MERLLVSPAVGSWMGGREVLEEFAAAPGDVQDGSWCPDEAGAELGPRCGLLIPARGLCFNFPRPWWHFDTSALSGSSG